MLSLQIDNRVHEWALLDLVFVRLDFFLKEVTVKCDKLGKENFNSKISDQLFQQCDDHFENLLQDRRWKRVTSKDSDTKIYFNILKVLTIKTVFTDEGLGSLNIVTTQGSFFLRDNLYNIQQCRSALTVQVSEISTLEPLKRKHSFRNPLDEGTNLKNHAEISAFRPYKKIPLAPPLELPEGVRQKVAAGIPIFVFKSQNPTSHA